MNTYLLIIITYFLFITLISFLSKKLASRSSADFLIAGRNLGLVATSLVITSEWIGGVSTIGVSQKAFTTGTMQGVLYNMSTALGLILIGFAVAKYYRQMKAHTVSELLENMFGRKARLVSAASFLFAYLIFAFVQLQTAAGVVSSVFGITWLQAVIVSSAIITIYTYIGGMHALAITGIIHTLAMFVGIGLAAAMGLIKVGGFAALEQSMIEAGSPTNPLNPFSGGLGYAWSLILGGTLGCMAGQASIQPIFSARSPLTAKRAALLAAIIIAPFGILTAILGLIAKTGNYFDISTSASPLWDAGLQSINSKLVLPTLLTTPEFVSPVIGGLALTGILAAILSTVGPVNFAVVTIATKDIYHGLLNHKANDENILSTARKLVIAVNLFTIPMAYFASGDVLDMAYISYGIRAIGAVVILLGLYARGWINILGVKMAFAGGTIAVIINIALRLLGLPHLEESYVAVGSAVFMVILARIIKPR